MAVVLMRETTSNPIFAHTTLHMQNTTTIEKNTSNINIQLTNNAIYRSRINDSDVAVVSAYRAVAA